jgi:hypothetical protein
MAEMHDEYEVLKPVEVILRKGEEGEPWRERFKLGNITCIYGNVTMNPFV